MARRKPGARDVHGILLLDKPTGMTSNGALQQIKRMYGAAKAGHTGSLDPLATGLLPICFGHATKLTTYLLESDKRYRVRARMGSRTDTADSDGEIVERTEHIAGAEALRPAIAAMLGEIEQIPPMYSAIKHRGRRLYELARKGEAVERQPRTVTIHSMQLLSVAESEFELDVHCSKGTYIRVLVEDLAHAAGTLAHVTMLRRTEVAPFSGEGMVGIAQLEQAASEGREALDRLLVSPSAAFAGWPQLSVDADRAFYLSRGQAVRVADAPKEGAVAVFGPDARLLGIAVINADGLVAPRRWMS